MKHNQMRQVVFPILAAFIWGTSFVSQDICADSMGAFTFNGTRYFIAVLSLLVVIAVIAVSFLPLLIQCCAYHLVFSAGNIVASATGGTKSAKLLSGLSDCVSLYISMVVFFSLIVISSTLVMILLGNGG